MLGSEERYLGVDHEWMDGLGGGGDYGDFMSC